MYDLYLFLDNFMSVFNVIHNKKKKLFGDYPCSEISEVGVIILTFKLNFTCFVSLRVNFIRKLTINISYTWI